MKLIYGTGNPAKLKTMREMLQGLPVELEGLKEAAAKTGAVLPEIDESGSHPLENARIKALAYYHAFRQPVFSCDSGLYIEELPEEEQPGVHVRRVNGKPLSDEEMILHYTAIAKTHGGAVRARYRNAVCLVLDEASMYEYDGEEIAGSAFLLVDTPHPRWDEGFPLDSISVEIGSGNYYMDMQDEHNSVFEEEISAAFRRFFAGCLPGLRKSSKKS